MAKELVVGALVSTSIQMTIECLVSCFQDYFRGKKLNKDLLSKLKEKLLCIDVLADDAEQKQFRDSRVRDWLLEAKDVVFDAEDLLAEIDVKLLKSSTVSSFKDEMERMKQILEDIERLLRISDCLGLEKNSGVGVGSGSGNESWKLLSTSLPSDSVIYGRDDDKESIINWLLSDTNKLSILSIVGMGGLGKTTLAQLVYNDSKIKGKFGIKAWVCVSYDFDVFKVTRTILEIITGSTDDSRNLEMVHKRLKHYLSGKKFLLVLDDVWNEQWHKWEEVQKPLVAFGAEGSRIIITTRTNVVASTMQSEEHNLKELQQEHCWQLFAKHAFPGDDQQSSYYKEIGMKIVEKCKGLPLALKSMGSLLHNKSSISEWQSMLESEVWQLKDNNVVPALALSYLHLPPNLRRCFAYCALFPKGHVFDKDSLIQLWVGENFLLCHEQNRSPEIVGEQVFSDLLSRSFFQQSSGFTDSFVMHDLLNDLAKFVVGDICFRLGFDRTKRIPKTTRHFSFSTSKTKDFHELESLHDGEMLHTFMPTDSTHWQLKVPIDDLISMFKFIRVLSLSGCYTLRELPQSVGNLKHLCSLDLSETVIEKLPESTCSLYNLQVLKLGGCRYLKELPSDLHKLTSLHSVDLSYTGIDKLPDSTCSLYNLQILKLGGCRHLKELPSNLHELTSLHSIDLSGRDKLPESTCLLYNLQILKLRGCTNLEELLSNLHKLTRLHSIDLSYTGIDKLPDSTCSLYNLQILKLDNCRNLKELPSDLRKLTSLHSIDLSNSGIEKLPESLCSLFNMQILKLNNCSYLKELPPNLHMLTRLQRLEFEETLITKVPLQLGKLKHLQVYMSSFDVGDSREFTIQQLGELNVHRSVSVENLQIIENPSDALAMGLKNKTHLVELELEWGQKREPRNMNLDDSLKEREETVIENLQPSKQLKKLSIRNYRGTKVPSWLFDNSLPNMVSLKLYNCQYFQRLPSLGLLPFLKELEIEKLGGIVSIDADFHGSEQFSFTSLETLKFCDMKEWERWGCEGVTGAFPRLQHLSLRNCPKLKGDLQLQNLHELYIYHCEQLETCAPKTLKLELHDSGKLQFDWAALKRLEMGGHNMEASLLEMIGHNRYAICLEELVIYCCPELIMCGDCCNREISDGSLVTFPLHFFPKLNSLTVKGFPDLQMISVERANDHLKDLRISECPQLESLPERMDNFLSSLESLSIKDCPRVEWVPGGYLPSNLKRMTLDNCSNLMVSLKGAFGANPSLEYLIVANLDVECFPDEGLLPLSLTSLHMLNCESLKNVEYRGLYHLSSLKQLLLIECPELECLPDEGLPRSISYLDIGGCPLLKQRCEELPEEWAKIAHIEDLII